MCIICTKKYNNKTKEITCCNNVTEIPFLPNLTYLWCCNNVMEIPFLPNLTQLWCHYSNITEIPLLSNLTILSCSDTNITKIPILLNLTYLYCYRTNITEIPFLPNITYLDYGYCKWFEQSYSDKEEFTKRIKNLIIIQRIWKNIRWNWIKKFIPLISDIRENYIKIYL
jgi:Leucine-rich repeat (LRR) protein